MRREESVERKRRRKKQIRKLAENIENEKASTRERKSQEKEDQNITPLTDSDFSKGLGIGTSME